MLALILYAVLAGFIAYCIRWRHKTLKIFEQHNIPGPPPSFIWGNSWEIYTKGHLKMQREWHKQYGPVFGYYIGMVPVMLVSDTDLLKSIQLKDFHKFSDRSLLMDGSLLEGFDSSLLQLRGQQWKDARATLTPSFTTKKLKQINPVMCSCIDNFIRNVDKAFHQKSSRCKIYDCFQALTLDSICKIGMGADFKIQDNFKNSKYIIAAKALFYLPINIFVVISASFPLLSYLFGKICVKILFRWSNHGRNPVSAFKKECKEVFRLRKANPTKYRRMDLLQLMMDAQRTKESTANYKSLTAGEAAEEIETLRDDKIAADGVLETESSFPNRAVGLTDDEVIDNAFLMLLAGYETTSSTMAYLTRLLMRYPEVQERMRVELLEATKGGKAFEFEHLQRCEYTEAVMQETLRIYPPVYFFSGRTASEDVKYGSMIIPKGMNVFCSVNELHNNEEIFPDPREFRPERFLPQNKTPAVAKSYQPFGAGPRNCIGMRFAQMTIKITMAKLLTKYRIASAKEPYYDSRIDVVDHPFMQRVRDSLECDVELL